MKYFYHILIAVVIIGTITFVSVSINNSLWDKSLHEIAEESYQSKGPIYRVVRGHHTKAVYETTKDAIVVTVSTDSGRIYRKVDLNKSRIVGEYIGRKFSEAKDGFLEGLKEPSKFKDDQ